MLVLVFIPEEVNVINVAHSLLLLFKIQIYIYDGAISAEFVLNVKLAEEVAGIIPLPKLMPRKASSLLERLVIALSISKLTLVKKFQPIK